MRFSSAVQNCSIVWHVFPPLRKGRKQNVVVIEKLLAISRKKYIENTSKEDVYGKRIKKIALCNMKQSIIYRNVHTYM